MPVPSARDENPADGVEVAAALDMPSSRAPRRGSQSRGPWRLRHLLEVDESSLEQRLEVGPGLHPWSPFPAIINDYAARHRSSLFCWRLLSAAGRPRRLRWKPPRRPEAGLGGAGAAAHRRHEPGGPGIRRRYTRTGGTLIWKTSGSASPDDPLRKLLQLPAALCGRGRRAAAAAVVHAVGRP